MLLGRVKRRRPVSNETIDSCTSSRRRRKRRVRVLSGSVRMKVRRLQKLVPGGKGLKPEKLFLRTADYIWHLKLRITALQVLLQISVDREYLCASMLAPATLQLENCLNMQLGYKVIREMSDFDEDTLEMLKELSVEEQELF